MSCPICNDTRWKSIEVDGVERVIRCDCWREALLDKAIASAGIPTGYRHCDLNNFEHRNEPALQDALAKAMGFVRRYPDKDAKGLFLLGRTGVGKTHLAVAMLKAAIEKTATPGYFFKAAELLQQIRNTYNKSVEDTEMRILEPIFEADILVLDDVGVERIPSDWAQETLGILIDKRYSAGKPIILTGNLNDASEAPAFFDSVQFKLGPRSRSRLLEMCEWVYIDADDRRELGGQPTDRALAQYKKRMADLTIQPADGAKGMAKARLRPSGPLDLKWTGGKAGS